MITLAVDTSSKACSCALVQEGLLLGESYCNGGLTHSATLMTLVENTIKTVRLSFGQIDQIAISIGPGSYTGLRIGLAAVKGMAAAFDTPCMGISTLLSLAYNVQLFDGVVCAALDARVGQVFAALFKVEGGVVTRLTDDDAMTLERLSEQLTDGALICGDGAELVCDKFPEKNLRLAPAAVRYQRASSVAIAAITEKYPAQSAAQLKAEYHRKSQAEREREAKQQQSGGNEQ